MNVITRDELKAALGTVTVVDTLGGDYYAQQHLPGAISLVESEVADRAAALLPDREAPIVTYCTNPSCPNSKAVATRLEALGYTDVRRYAEGIEDWVEAGLPVESA
ncbi:rhodanese-like domain-containing protein [Nonomuraea turkmeniaca]|uniref:Rhodanese-like domain-containing protein n=1 Tax=Nonomuraea turkmeniaca TaxID=103838 RepID=A0A5S4F783_9ACTN|nr:rhodanese-like domain-containing protein [Nonomuraea turkmeniaca]TMR12094.1 rhodanese-like domain-containing protein [Nonomuraea turkmeniaca]